MYTCYVYSKCIDSKETMPEGWRGGDTTSGKILHPKDMRTYYKATARDYPITEDKLLPEKCIIIDDY
jgi:hypothetical protein